MPHLVDFDAGRFRLCGQLFFAASSPVREDQMQPGITAGYLESPVEGPQLPKQQIVFHAVLLSHLIQIPFKITVFDKFIEYGLVDPRYGGRIETALLPVARKQRIRQHHITDTDGRRDRFGECADIDHVPVAVRRLQGRKRLALIAEFTVVVIFYQITPLFLRRPL